MFKKTTTEIKGETIIIKVPSIADWTLTDLRKCCKKNKVKGYTKMDKWELVKEVRKIIDNIKQRN